MAAAAQVCGEKIRHIATIPCDSLGTAMSTYVGQNYGAKKIGRIKEGVKGGLLIQLVICVVTWAVLMVLGKPLVYLLQGTMKVLRGVVQGMGYGFSAMVSGVMEILGRILCGALAVSYGSFTLICLSNPMAWGFAMTYCLFPSTYYLWKKTKEFAAG